MGFGEVKATKTDDFLCLNPKNFSTRVVTVLLAAKFLKIKSLLMLLHIKLTINLPIGPRECKKCVNSQISVMVSQIQPNNISPHITLCLYHQHIFVS